MRERFDKDFVAKYHGTAHRTGVTFFDAARRAEVQQRDATLHMQPGDWLVTLPDGGRYVLPASR